MMDVKENVKISATTDEVMDNVGALNQRYELAAWGALFILFGAIDLIPGVPAGMEWLGIAFILLGLNLVRCLSKIPASIISVTLGIIALVLGTSRLLHLRGPLPLFETVLIVIGVVLLVSSATRRSHAGCFFCKEV